MAESQGLYSGRFSLVSNLSYTNIEKHFRNKVHSFQVDFKVNFGKFTHTEGMIVRSGNIVRSRVNIKIQW